MHLSYKTSRYKDKIYKSYFLAESYREGNMVRKRPICHIGKLTDLQAKQIKLICKIKTDPDQVFTSIEHIVAEEVKQFLDLAVANALWDQWKLSKAFHHVTENTELSTPLVAKILTINRCTAPCAHYSIPHWIRKTALEEVVGGSLELLSDDKIYYELDKIDENQEYLENYLFHQTYIKDKASYDVVNYDLSSSYFVGMKCELSKYGISKDHQSHRKQVLLGMMVNAKGYPFKWDVYPGNKAEVKTLVKNVDACRRRFKLKNITLVFDRGIVSDKNLDYITEKKLNYISALNRDQIEGIKGIDLSVFEKVGLENFNVRLSQAGFHPYDEMLYFKDLGVINQRRYILGFNPIHFKDEKKRRHEKIAVFERFLKKKNTELTGAKRSRKCEPTYQSILDELKRLKIKKYFHNPTLKDLEIQRTNKKGQICIVKSFQIAIEKKKTQIEQAERLDGLCVFVSNHIESAGEDSAIEKSSLNEIFQLTAEKIIQAYREKNKIEDGFKHIKSFLEIRPFYVNTPNHVRAVYTICILSYFLNKDLAERRKKIEKVDYLNSKNLYEPFRSCHYVTLRDNKSLRKKSEPVELSKEQKRLLKELNIEIKLPGKIM